VAASSLPVQPVRRSRTPNNLAAGLLAAAGHLLVSTGHWYLRSICGVVVVVVTRCTCWSLLLPLLSLFAAR
jgi:hypothetical protein